MYAITCIYLHPAIAVHSTSFKRRERGEKEQTPKEEEKRISTIVVCFSNWPRSLLCRAVHNKYTILLSLQFTFTVHTVCSFVQLPAVCSVNDFQTNKSNESHFFSFSLAMSILSVRKRQWMNLTACIIVFFVWSVEVMQFVCTMNSGCNANIYSIQMYTWLFPLSLFGLSNTS